VVADYPGQSGPAGAITIQNGQVITLNVSPASAVGSLTIQGGAANTGLNHFRWCYPECDRPGTS
jgi:hypothetical protein